MIKTKPVDRSAFTRLYPFESRYLDRNGLKYHFLDEGTGDPLVMVHGNPTWSFYFRNLITALSPDYRIIAVDHMGCGLSDKPGCDQYNFLLKNRVDDLEALINYLNPARPLTLVLHDWGGCIGMAYGLRHPERIGRIVIMNTAAFLPPSNKRLPLRLRLVRNTGILGAAAVLGFNLFARGALIMASCRPLPKPVRTGLLAPYNCRRNRLATLKFVRDIPLGKKDPSYGLVRWVDENLHHLSHVPMLICWGERDFVFDRDYLSIWRRRFPHAQVHSFTDAGHYVLEDVPEKIIELMKSFLKKHAL